MEIVSTSNAPQAIGPYSQATVVGDFVFTAGQIALDPATMELVSGEVVEQTEQVFANLKAVLEAAGTELGNVVKTTVYLADMAGMASSHADHGTPRSQGSASRSAAADPDRPGIP